jgi:hypothetical protein
MTAAGAALLLLLSASYGEPCALYDQHIEARCAVPC